MRKKLAFICIVLASLATAEIQAQGGPPPWAPAHGYRAKARYTYFPTLGFYFDTKIGIYFFLEAGVWTRHNSLPDRYRKYNWKNYRYEEFDWASNQPWEKHHGKGLEKGSPHPGNGPGNGHGKSKGKKSMIQMPLQFNNGAINKNGPLVQLTSPITDVQHTEAPARTW